jgi:hypothetical protein
MYRLNKQAATSDADELEMVAPKAGGTKPNYISLTKDIARQKKLAEALSAIGNTQYDDQEYGGIVVPRSPLSLLTSAAGNFGGAYLEGKAGDTEAKLKAEKTAAALAQFDKITGKTEEPVDVRDAVFDEMTQDVTVAPSSGRFKPTYTLPEQREKFVAMGLGADDNEYAKQYAERGLANVDYETGRADRADAAKLAADKVAYDKTRDLEADKLNREEIAARGDIAKAQREATVEAARLRAQIAQNARDARPPTHAQSVANNTANTLKYVNDRLTPEVLAAGGDLTQKGMSGVPGVNMFLSDARKAYENSVLAFTNAKLRQESGAVIGDKEYIKAEKQYFPMPGDDSNTLKQKAQLREMAFDTQRVAAGPYYEDLTPPLDQEAPVPADEAAAVAIQMRQWNAENPFASDEDREGQELEFRSALGQ